MPASQFGVNCSFQQSMGTRRVIVIGADSLHEAHIATTVVVNGILRVGYMPDVCYGHSTAIQVLPSSCIVV